MAVQFGLCRTWSETPKAGFLTTRLIWNKSCFVMTRFIYIYWLTVPILIISNQIIFCSNYKEYYIIKCIDNANLSLSISKVTNKRFASLKVRVNTLSELCIKTKGIKYRLIIMLYTVHILEQTRIAIFYTTLFIYVV